MTVSEIPYFMTNEEWFYFDEKDCRYYLTEKAPRKARKSYEAYYKQLDDIEE